MTERRYELIIFDWDGTLMDSHGAIVQCTVNAAAEAELSEPENKMIRASIGLSLQAMTYNLYPDIGQTQARKFTEVYRQCYFSQAKEIFLFDGVSAMLQQLTEAGYLLTIATGKGRRGLDRDLASTGVEHFFRSSRTVDEAAAKPQPEMAESILTELAILPEQALVIGDSQYDILMAANAGIDSLAVGHSVADSGHFDDLPCLACLDKVTELPAWLQQKQ